MADRTALARQIIDQWPSDDGSADDVENYLDFGLWSQTKQPLQRRGTLLPFGQYEDGSILPAWPAALADPYEAAVRGLEGPDAVRPEDALIAAGGAALGGIPFAVKGAVGSAGGRLMQGADLPMDLASRMARAREMGFDTDRVLYHGTDAKFDEFDLDKFGKTDWGFRGRGVYLTPDKELARRYGKNVDSYLVRGKVGSSDDAAIQDIRGAAWKEANEEGQAQGFDEYALEAFRKEQMNKALRDAGYSGYFDETGQEYVIFDPRRIRSVNAAFDPAKADSANLLAANAPTGAPFALAGDEFDIEGNALMDALRRRQEVY